MLLRPIVDTIRERPAALAEELLVLARLEHDAGDVAAATAIADEALRVARLSRRPAVEADAWMTLARLTEGDAAHVRFCARMALAAKESASSSSR